MKTSSLTASLLALSLACASQTVACGSETSASPGASNDEGTVARSALARNTSPSVSPADAEALRDGNTAFATDLYQTLRKDPAAKGKNLFFSPHSISTALAMTFAGARGQTEKEMASTMHYDLPQDRL